MKIRPCGGWSMLAVAVAVAVGVTGCHPEGGGTRVVEALPVVPVRVAAASAGRHAAIEEVVGTVRPRVRAVLESKVSGRISALRAVPGQAVKAGEVLVEVDAREIEARVEQARAVLEQAERDLARFATLLRQEAVTRAEHDAVEARQRVAKAALAEAETMRGYTRVAAPFDGLVSRKLAEVGDLAAPGRGLLEVEDPATARFEADMPLGLSGKVQLGAKFPVTLNDGGAGAVVEGRVSEIEPVADPVSRTFRVKLDLAPDARWRAGMFGRVAVPGAESVLLSVPAASVVVRGQMEYVLVESGGKARLRVVRTGKRIGDDVQVLSGLEAGERVVAGRVDGPGAAGGVGTIQDGQPVEAR